MDLNVWFLLSLYMKYGLEEVMFDLKIQNWVFTRNTHLEVYRVQNVCRKMSVREISGNWKTTKFKNLDMFCWCDKFRLNWPGGSKLYLTLSWDFLWLLVKALITLFTIAGFIQFRLCNGVFYRFLQEIHISQCNFRNNILHTQKFLNHWF